MGLTKSRALQRLELSELISEKQFALKGCVNILKEGPDAEIVAEVVELKQKLELEIPELKRQLELLNEDLKPKG